MFKCSIILCNILNKYLQVNGHVFNISHNLQARQGDVWLSQNVRAGKLGWTLHCPGQIVLGRLCHSLQSRGPGCRYTLAETLVQLDVCFHCQADKAHQRGCLVTSSDRRLRGRVQWPRLQFFFPGNFIPMASPAFKGERFLMPLLYCLHCTLFLAASLRAVVLVSLFGWRSVSAVGSKVRLRRPISL